MLYENFVDLVGNTPLIRLKNIEKIFNLKAKLYGKAEFMNPAGSIKDRVAVEMFLKAEADGKIKKDTLLIEPTSGNTGIGLAAVAASRGYKLTIIMPDSMSLERRQTMKLYGAKLILTPGKMGMKGAIEKAELLKAENPNSFIFGQFSNPANPLAHYNHTAPEIWNDTEGKVDIVVAGVGTGGTLSGIGKFLKAKKSDVKMIAVEPSGSAVLSGENKGTHKIQGIGAGFIPDNFDKTVCDSIEKVSDEDAYKYAILSAREEGLSVGISSGAAISAAVKIGGKSENEGKVIVVILPDGGNKYLSSGLVE